MIINISGFGDVEVDDGFVNLSQQEQQKSVQRIVSYLEGRQQNNVIPDSNKYENLKSFIGRFESNNDYSVIVGGEKDPNILNKTISELYNEKGGRLAIGRYQIQMRTALDVLKKNKINPKNFKFDKKGQDELFVMLSERRGLKDFEEGKITTENFARNLSKEWASLPKDETNKGYYEGIAGNKSLTNWNETIDILNKYKNVENANKRQPAKPEQVQKPTLSFQSMANKIKKDKTKTPEEKQNLLFQTLDVLNAPQYAIANAIYQAYTNEDFELGKSLWEGLTLQEKRSVGDTLSEAIQPETKLGKIAVGTVGFVGDVLTDPLTYTGVGLLAKSGKLTKAGSTAEKMIKAGRAAGKAKETKAVFKFAGAPIPKSEIVVDPIARGLTKTGMIVREDLGAISTILSRVGEKISTRMRPKGVDPVEWEKFLIAREKAKNIERSAKLTAIEKAKEIYKSFKDEGLDEAQVTKIVDDIEKMQPVTSRGGQIAKETTEEFQKLYQQVGETGKEIIQEQGYQYLPHINVKRNQKIKNAIGYTKKDFSTSSPSDIKRTILKYTDEKGEDFVLSTKTGKVFKDGKQVKILNKKSIQNLEDTGTLKQASISDINKAYGDTVFSTDLPALVAIQGLRTAKVIGGDEFFKQAKKLSSKTQKKVNGVDYIESNAPELAGQYFHPEIVKHIDATKKSLIDEDSPLKLLRELTNVWKASATLWAPSFHTRNAMSNIWQNSLAGVTNPIDFSKALVITKKMKSNSKLTPDELQIVKEYKSQGLEKVGQLSGDIGQSIKNEIMTTMDVLKKRKNPYEVLNKIGGSLGDAIETQAKLHHFISKRKEGLSPFDAGMSVKKYLFDYEDLTKFEKNILKPFLPFYTFTRKNIPVQIETLLKNPARQTKLIKAKNNVEILAGDDETEAILPEWIRNAAPVFVGKKDGKVRYVKLEGFLPTADLNKLSDPGKALLDMVTPIIKAPVEQITNYNFFFGKKITEKKGLVEGFTGYGEEDLLWYRIPARINHLAGLFRPIREIDKIVGTKYKTQNTFEKLSNFLIGGKLYEYDVRELLEQFDYISESDMRAIKKEINILKQRIRENPEYKDSYIDDIKLLKKSYIKSKRKSIKEKTEARKSLRSGK